MLWPHAFSPAGKKLGHMFGALAEASRMLDAVLDHRDCAAHARRLAVRLDDVECNCIGTAHGANEMSLTEDIFLNFPMIQVELIGDGKHQQLQFRWEADS